ncbi:Uncharacterized protein BWINRA5_06009 [Bacillus mycoides]|uniref:radical SAM protein n=1 Tax=Bacillus mycoides TaxID=1405 RepID=UPI0008176375|nr:radical SAM protein [Bacillus mycoides]SCB02531.1 Uncharacterized protein BWINRA5_06009 [Bacillus mycoides]
MNEKLLLPQSISLYVTYNCQLSCEHCFLTQTGRLNKYTLDMESIKHVIDEAHKHNVFLVAISGGDPLLHPNIYEILELLQQKGIVALLGITGIDITKEQVLKIKSLGVPCIQVSLDGIDEISNSFFRGSSVYDNVIESVRLIQSIGIHTNLAICISKDNKHLLKDMLNLCNELNIYKVKVAFLEPILGKEQLNLRVLSEGEKQQVLSVCKDFNTNKKESWIMVPGYNVYTGAPNTPGKYPSLVIGADGVISIDEFGKNIGHISDDPISKTYGKFIKESLNNFIDNLIINIKENYNITSIEAVPYQKLNSAALVFKFGSSYQIMYRDDLPTSVRLFSIIHEAAHIAEDTIAVNPYDVHKKEVELSANLWALNYLKPHLNTDFFERANELAYLNEDLLFKYIEENLMNNLINYWGNNQ